MTAGRHISEKDLAATVIEMARAYGWLVAGVVDQRVYARRFSAGVPDLMMVRGKRLVFAELKSQRGKVTPEQQEWLSALVVTGAEVYLWQPQDLDLIEEVLR